MLGSFGERSETIARRLLDANQVTVLASDGHNTRVRRPVLSEAFEHISEHHGEARARMLLLENPQRIVATQFSALVVAG